MPTTAESSGRRLALVIATGTYADPALAKLRAPGRDATDLADVLGDIEIGGFEVETVLDARAEVLRRQVAEFCAGIGPHDLTLVYLSCHGVLDDRGRLYYATADTDRELLSATALPAAWLNEQLEDCRSRRQILVLDCCHSGAFAKGAKGEGELALGERFEGRGRVVLTGSRGTEYSFEHGDVVGEGVSSVFTGALVSGLRSGEADRDGDGQVTIGELYDYVYETVRTREARQTPTLWTYGAEGDLKVAQSPRGRIVEPVPLPEELLTLLESSRPGLREGAVAELAVLLEGSDPGRALSAREALERVAAEDVPRVAKAARAALGAAPEVAGTAKAPPPPDPSPPTPPPPAGPDDATPPVGFRDPEPPGPRDPRPPRWGSSPAGRRRLIAIAGGIATIVVIAIVIAATGGGGSGPETFDLGGELRGIAIGSGTWIARHDHEQVTRIDSSSNEHEFEVGLHPGRVAAAGDIVWVGYEGGQMLARLDPESGEIIKTVSFGEGCGCRIEQMEIADGQLWISSMDTEAGNGTMYSLNPRTGVQSEEYGPIDGFEGQFALDQNAVWAICNGGGENSWLERIDISSSEEKKKFSSSNSYFEGVAYGHERVWIADSHRNVVTSVETATEKPTYIPIANGVNSNDIVFAEDSVLVWDPVAGILTKIDADTREISGTQTIPGFDQSKEKQELNTAYSELAVGNEYAWVTDPANGTVRKLEY